MPQPRVNNAKAKRIRANLRARGEDCHACGGEIHYAAHHHDPLSFQVDHLWPLAAGGPQYDPDNCAPAHRVCNRRRSNTIDDIAVEAACRIAGVILTPTNPDKTHHAPDGQPCDACNGTHKPATGVTFITDRNWWTKPTTDQRSPTPTHADDGIGLR